MSSHQILRLKIGKTQAWDTGASTWGKYVFLKIQNNYCHQLQINQLEIIQYIKFKICENVGFQAKRFEYSQYTCTNTEIRFPFRCIPGKTIRWKTGCVMTNAVDFLCSYGSILFTQTYSTNSIQYAHNQTQSRYTDICQKTRLQCI